METQFGDFNKKNSLESAIYYACTTCHILQQVFHVGILKMLNKSLISVYYKVPAKENMNSVVAYSVQYLCEL